MKFTSHMLLLKIFSLLPFKTQQSKENGHVTLLQLRGKPVLTRVTITNRKNSNKVSSYLSRFLAITKQMIQILQNRIVPSTNYLGNKMTTKLFGVCLAKHPYKPTKRKNVPLTKQNCKHGSVCLVFS